MRYFFTFFIILSIISGCGALPFNPIEPGINLFLMWKNGEGHKYYLYDSDTVYRAIKRSCSKMGYTIIRDDPASREKNYYIVAGSNDKFKIKVQTVERYVSRLSIRINFFGDKQYAELLFQEVDKELNIIEYDPSGKPRNLLNKRSV